MEHLRRYLRRPPELRAATRRSRRGPGRPAQARVGRDPQVCCPRRPPPGAYPRLRAGMRRGPPPRRCAAAAPSYCQFLGIPWTRHLVTWAQPWLADGSCTGGRRTAGSSVPLSGLAGLGHPPSPTSWPTIAAPPGPERDCRVTARCRLVRNSLGLAVGFPPCWR
jgi:hypothetical protein